MSTAETILLLKLAKSIKDIKSRAPEKGDRGREPTADEIKQAVELYMAFNAESFRGAPGKAAKANNGEDGVGIDDIEWVGNTVIFHLTDGREIEHKLPRTRDVFMGGGGLGAGEIQKMIDDALEVALAGPIEVRNDTGDQLRADSNEIEYLPGLTTMLVTSAGDTVVYTAPVDKAFRLYSMSAVPVLRGVEDAPVITVLIKNSDGSPFKTAYIGAAISKRKLITCPVGGKIVVNIDIAARLPTTFDIEEFAP